MLLHASAVVNETDGSYHMHVKLRNVIVPAGAAILGVFAALYALGNSRVPVWGLAVCPALFLTWPVFSHFFELDDVWLWTSTVVVNAIVYALLARGVLGYVLRRSRQRTS